MNITDLELEALRKFNSGKNAEAFANELDPGTYPVKLTVTLEGELRKGKPGITRSRNTSGTANIVRYLLDRINDATYVRMLHDLDAIRAGKIDIKEPTTFARRLEMVMPYRDIPRAGTTKYNGNVFVEDIIEAPNLEDLPTGLRLIQGDSND